MRKRKNSRKPRTRIAVIGEGKTEWCYFDLLKKEKGKDFALRPSFPQHSDYKSIVKKAKALIDEGYDQVYCVLDLDTVVTQNRFETYQKFKRDNSSKALIFIESMPCIELWFLIHFDTGRKVYDSCRRLIKDRLNLYFPNYEKGDKYLPDVYDKLSQNLDKAVKHAKELEKRKVEVGADSRSPYTQVYKIIEEIIPQK